MLEDLVAELLSRSQATGFRHLLDLEDWTVLQPEHQPILDAIAARDAEAVRNAMARHFDGLRQSLNKSIDA